MIVGEIRFGPFQVRLGDINAENIAKMKLADVRGFKKMSGDTKAERSGIIKEGCQRIGN